MKYEFVVLYPQSLALCAIGALEEKLNFYGGLGYAVVGVSKSKVILQRPRQEEV